MTTSVRTKILVPLIVGLLLLGVLGVFTMHRYFAQKLTEQAMLRVETLADAIRKSVETNSNETEQRRLVSAFGSTPGVNLIIVVAGEPAMVVASTHNAWTGRALGELPEKTVASDLREALSSNAASRHYHHDSDEFDFTLPLLLPDQSTAGLVRGAVMVHLDARPVNYEIVNTTLVWSGLYLLLLVAVAGLIYATVYRWVLRPVGRIQEAVARRSGGDEGARSPQLADDEIGQLSSALNALMDQIAQEQKISSLYNERLKDSESQTRAILDSVRDGIIFADNRGTVRTVNPGAEQIFGYTAAQMVGRNLSMLMPPQTGKQHDQYMRNYTQTGVAKIIGIGRELEGRRADGSLFPLELSITEVKLGEQSYFTGIVRDITDRKRTETALRDSEQRWLFALDGAEDGVWDWDVATGLVYFSPRWKGMLGYAEDEINNSFDEFDKRLHPEDREQLYAALQEHLSGKIPAYQHEFRLRAKDGSYRWILTRGKVVQRDKEGKPLRVIGTHTDISERKHVERELVVARTQAEEASRAKSEFLATMSHEIRTPLNGVLGMAQVLGKTQLSSDQKQYVDTIVKSGKALLTVLNDILDFSKIEAGRLELESLDFNFERTAKEVVQLYGQQAFNKGLDLALRYAPDCPRFITGDPGRLRQVLLNLVGNALKFTDRGHVLVDVSLQQRTPERVWLKVAVTDTGIGLSLDAQTKLFSAFSQADASTTRKYGGTGLGLAICRRLVEMMGGKIGVQSSLGEGTTFWFAVPCALPQEIRELPQVDLSGSCVLAVSYSDMNAKLLAEQLEGLGVEALIATTNPEALDIISQAPSKGQVINAVVLDVNVSNVEDQGLIDAIRGNDPEHKVPIVVLTAVPTKGDGQRFREAKVDGYLCKPVTAEEMRDMLLVVLGRVDRSPLETRHSLEEARSASERFHGRVLLAEDVDFNQMVVKTLLEQLGLHVDIANDGAEAVRDFAKAKYDLVLMDCQMPVLDGYDATRAIRSTERSGTHVPIIALTANALESDRQKCLDAGMDDFIPKPIEESVLRSKLTSWLRDGSNSQVAATAANTLPESAVAETDRVTELCSEARFNQLKRLMSDKFPALVESFVANAEGKLVVLADAAAANDAETLHSVGHALKGIAGNIGAVGLQHLAAELEQRAQAGETQGAVERVRQMQATFTQTRDWLLSRSIKETSGIT